MPSLGQSSNVLENEMRYLIFLFFAALVGGCANSTVPLGNDADWVPPSRIFGFTERSDAHLVVVLDDVGDGACRMRLSIDGKPAAEMSDGEAVRFRLTMGLHQLLARPSESCTQDRSRSALVTVKSGDELVVKVDSEKMEKVAIEGQAAL